MDNRRNEPNLKLINMEQVEIEKIDWLLYPFIPFGKVTIVQGDPGEGKTTMVLQIIAKLTKGEAVLPSGSDESALEEKTMVLEPVNVIYQTAEDGLGDTIKPRLLSAGADCSRVMVIDDNDQALTMMDARLEEAIIQTKARLVVLDPIQGFLGTDVDMHRANEIRPLMKRVALLAEKYHCAIILIGHMNKNSNGKAEKCRDKYQQLKKDYDDLEKDADKVADLCNQLCDDVDKLEVISDKYNRALRIFGSDTIESAIWHDIQREKALEEQKRKEQVPRKLNNRLQWGREKSQEYNMQQKKNKNKHREMDL